MRSTRLTATAATLAVFTGLSLIATATFAAAEGTQGNGLAYSDRTFQTFTAANGLSSRYHVYASGIPQDHAAGLVLQFHGDAAYEFNNPASSYSLGGQTGIVAQSRARGYITVPVLAPDTQGTVTWWENGSANADFVADLLRTLEAGYNIDTEDIWLVGYSGGAQFITQFYLPKYSSTIDGGGTVVFGGGGIPRVSALPFSPDLVSDLPMHWYTGAADTSGSDGYNALLDAQKGSAWYADRGFEVDLQSPTGLGHDLSGRFGPVLAGHLDDHTPGGGGVTVPTTSAAPTAPPTTTTVPVPTTTVPVPTTTVPVPTTTVPVPTTTVPVPTTTTAPPTTTTVPVTTTTTVPVPTTTTPPAWNYTLTPTRKGADVAITIPPGTSRTTFRVTALTGPFYVYTYTTSTGQRTLSILTSLTPGTGYNYTMEADGAIVGSGSFQTLP